MENKYSLYGNNGWPYTMQAALYWIRKRRRRLMAEPEVPVDPAVDTISMTSEAKNGVGSASAFTFIGFNMLTSSSVPNPLGAVDSPYITINGANYTIGGMYWFDVGSTQNIIIVFEDPDETLLDEGFTNFNLGGTLISREALNYQQNGGRTQWGSNSFVIPALAVNPFPVGDVVITTE